MILVSPTAARGVLRSAAEPACPHASDGADRNMGPPFCVIDHPVALGYLAPLAKHTFALGPKRHPIAGHSSPISSAPAQTHSAARSTGSPPGGNRWRFAVSPALSAGVELHFQPNWCADPVFNGIGS